MNVNTVTRRILAANMLAARLSSTATRVSWSVAILNIYIMSVDFDICLTPEYVELTRLIRLFVCSETSSDLVLYSSSAAIVL